MRTHARSFMMIAMSAVAMSATPTLAQLVNYELVPVGNPGNANDPVTDALFGGVGYEYQIGKYEVTIGQYAAFLNAVAKADPYDLYSPTMGASPNIAGITRIGSSGSYTYGVVGPSGTAPSGANSPSDRPITLVSWLDSARFANWMSNGQPTGAQNSTTTENGAYALNGAMSGTAPAMNAINPNTGSTPLFRIPTESEWYKAAFYSPVLNSGSGGYYRYATQSNSAPGNMIGSGTNQVNRYSGGWAVTQSATYSASQNYLTDVGAFTNSASQYGTFDQSGNVWEWNDLTGTGGSTSGARGGSWSTIDDPVYVSSAFRSSAEPSTENEYFGFRLASPIAVPEPSTWVMGMAGLGLAGYSMWRRRKRA